MQTDPQGFCQKRDRITRDVILTRRPMTANCAGESFSPLPPPLHLLCQAVEAVWLEDHASTITLESRDTIVTTTISRPARSTLTHQHTFRHHTASALKRDVSEGGEREALQRLAQPAAHRREGRFLGSAPTTTPLGLHSTSTQW